MAPILILILFAWVLFEIALEQRQVSRQHAAIDTFQTRMAETINLDPKHSISGNPALSAEPISSSECSRREPSSLHEAVPAAASLDAGTLDASYGPLNVYAWILPVLGFIGTASGMASAIDGFSEVLRGGQVNVDQLAAELSQSVIPGLSAAFETTILALAAALVTYLCTNALRSWDQEALDQLDRLCIVLLSRMPQPPTPDGQKIPGCPRVNLRADQGDDPGPCHALERSEGNQHIGRSLNFIEQPIRWRPSRQSAWEPKPWLRQAMSLVRPLQRSALSLKHWKGRGGRLLEMNAKEGTSTAMAWRPF